MDVNRLRPESAAPLKKACPLHPQTKMPSLLVPVNALPHPARRISGPVVYGVLTALAGILMIAAALLWPQSSPIIVTPTQNGTDYSVWVGAPHSLVSTLFPIGLSLLVGFIATPFIPGYGRHAFRQRAMAGVLFAIPVAIAYFVDQLALSCWFLQYGSTLELPPEWSWVFLQYMNGALWTLNAANWPLILLQNLVLAPLLALLVFAISFVGDFVFGVFSIIPFYGTHEERYWRKYGPAAENGSTEYLRGYTARSSWQARSRDKSSSLFFIKAEYGVPFVSRTVDHPELEKRKAQPDY